MADEVEILLTADRYFGPEIALMSPWAVTIATQETHLCLLSKPAAWFMSEMYFGLTSSLLSVREFVCERVRLCVCSS